MAHGEQSRLAHKQLLILGAGYIGQALAAKALAEGMRIAALTRNSADAEVLRSMGVSPVVEADLASCDWHGELRGPYDFVVNCVSSGGGGVAGYRHSYLEGQRSLCRWLSKRRVPLVVYTSSTSVYPQVNGELVDEATPLSGVSEAAGVLLESERLLLETAGEGEVRIVLRLAGIYGPGRHHYLDQLHLGETVFPGKGDDYLNLVHRDDVIGALMTVFRKASSEDSGCYNLSDGCHETKAAILQWLAEALGITGVRFDPELTSSRASRRQNAAGMVPNRRVDNSRFCQVFDWKPLYPSFREGYLSIWRGM